MEVTPECLLRALDLVALDGVVVRNSGGRSGLLCEARFLPRPFEPGTEGPAPPPPRLTAWLDPSVPISSMRRSVAERNYPSPLRERFAGQAGSTSRWFGWVTLGSPSAVELVMPNGIQLLGEDEWSAAKPPADASLRLGLDLLAQGVLVLVGDRCGVMPYPDSKGGVPAGGRFWFLRPVLSRRASDAAGQ